jgi:folylpolyglutamate synthase/dihydropteroate synthase
MTKNTDRIQVTEDHTVMFGMYDRKKIPDLIRILQHLQNEGWEYIETDKAADYDEDYYCVKATRKRLENDVEYQKRMKHMQDFEDSQRRQYEALKKQFENT